MRAGGRYRCAVRRRGISQRRWSGAAAAHGVIGVRDAHLDPELLDQAPARDADADRCSIAAQIAAQNERLARNSIRPCTTSSACRCDARSEQVRAWIEGFRAARAARSTTRTASRQSERSFERLIANARNSRRSRSTQPRAIGMVVHRADLRTFPTRLRVFSSPGDTDIDRFQESALFPGTPVADRCTKAATARGGSWSATLRGVDREAVTSPQGARDASSRYARKTPYLIVTGATARTVFTPRAARSCRSCSSTWACACRCWPTGPAISLSTASIRTRAHVIELPMRREDGALRSRRRCCRRPPTSRTDYLPLTRANLLRQSFKFLGERYGWGHAYNARDCSGFVSEVYRSFGVQLPRNTRDQAVSPALEPHRVHADDASERRLRIARDARRSAISSTSRAT